MEAAAPFDPVAAFSGLIVLVKSMLGALIFPARAAEALALYNYLARTARRFGTLAARIRAGNLAPLPFRQRAAPTARTHAPDAEADPAAHAPKIPRQRAWLLRNIRGTPGIAAYQLTQMLAQPETQALIAADPIRMGRLLRPLWNLVSADPLPENLRLPPRARRIRVRPRPVFTLGRRPLPPRRDATAPALTVAVPATLRRNGR